MFDLSTSSPLTGALVAYLLPCVASALAALAAWHGFRRLRDETLREAALTFAVVAAIQAVLLVGGSAKTIVPDPVLRALDCASAAVMGWVFLGRARRAFLVGTLAICGTLGSFTLSLWQLTGKELAWSVPLWSLGSAAIYAVAALFWVQRRERPLMLFAALVVLALGSFLGAMGLTAGTLALRLIAFPLLPMALMQLSTRELEGAKSELESFSEHSLRQTQQLVTLLRTSTGLVSHFDVASILREAVEGVALGVGADSTLIAILEDTPEHTMHVQITYPPTLMPRDTTFQVSSQPAIARAIQSGQQIVLAQPQRGAHALAKLMGSDFGPTIIQPMNYRERTLGVIVALNGHSRRAFTQDEQRVLEAFAAQVAAAAENASLYRRLDAQARELARLLATREEEANRQSGILESIADGVIVTDNQDQVMLANPAAAHILEIPCEELIGQPFGAIFGQVIPLSSSGVMGEPTTPGQDALRAVFQIGSRFIQSSLAPVQSSGGRHLGLVAVLRDVTAERAAEQAKTEFISTISHELRTPLTSIKGYADLLVAGAAGEMTTPQRSFAESIRTGAERLGAIVNAVIQFSEMERGIQIQAQPVDMGALVAEVVGAMRSRVEARGLALSMDVAVDLPKVHADPERTQHIVEQLVDNAMRFTPAGGQVDVRATPSWDGVNAEQPSFVAITVADTGVGLTRPDQERIFERFYRAENPMHVTAGGLGIGLSIARALAEAQGGHLWAVSPEATDTQPGHGSRFTLLLPVAQPGLAPPTPQETADLTTWLEEALSFLDEEK